MTTSNLSSTNTPNGLYTGLRAITQQTYLEANVKNGLQFEFSSYNATLAAGATQYAIFRVGAKPVLLKARVITFTGAGITARVYKAPVTSGGSAAQIFNLRTDNLAIATTCQIISGVTVSNVGTEIAAPTYGVGSTGVGQAVVGTFTVPSTERLLAPNTDYLLAITNNDSSACRVATYATWYEGDPDLPTSD